MCREQDVLLEIYTYTHGGYQTSKIFGSRDVMIFSLVLRPFLPSISVTIQKWCLKWKLEYRTTWTIVYICVYVSVCVYEYTYVYI